MNPPLLGFFGVEVAKALESLGVEAGGCRAGGVQGFRVWSHSPSENGMKEGCEFGKLWAIDREQGS